MDDLNPDRWLEMLEDKAMSEPEPRDLDDGDCEVSDGDQEEENCRRCVYWKVRKKERKSIGRGWCIRWAVYNYSSRPFRAGIGHGCFTRPTDWCARFSDKPEASKNGPVVHIDIDERG